MSASLFERIGGRPTLERVHRRFYGAVLAHPWLGQYFGHVKRAILESQQTDFMTRAMGGPAIYCGRLPVATHKNMFITTALFDLRHALLGDAIAGAGVDPELGARWLRIDNAFRGKLCKSSMSECERRFKTDSILAFADPTKKAS